MEAIILAGGLGTRLRGVVNNVPKPMAPVCGKPFLEYILSYLKKNGVSRVILAVGYKSDIIKEYFKNSFMGIELCYSVEEYPLGTGGCIKKALKLCKEKNVYIINGDTFFDVDLKKLQIDCDVAIACKYLEDFNRYGKVVFDSCQVIKEFQEKKEHQTGYINGGIYRFRRDLLDSFHFDEKFSLETDFFEKYIDRITIRAVLCDNYFIDIGIPSDYVKANEDFKNE